METTTHTAAYTVQGMTCGHCVAAVTEEVAGLPGVIDVTVELATGRLTVTGDATLDALRGAVEEAGYELTQSGQRTWVP